MSPCGRVREAFESFLRHSPRRDEVPASATSATDDYLLLHQIVEIASCGFHTNWCLESVCRMHRNHPRGQPRLRVFRFVTNGSALLQNPKTVALPVAIRCRPDVPRQRMSGHIAFPNPNVERIRTGFR
jgi:hypothetical protein